MGTAKTIFATAFKATCLHVLDRVQSDEWMRVEVTKRDRVVAALTTPPTPWTLQRGCMAR